MKEASSLRTHAYLQVTVIYLLWEELSQERLLNVLLACSLGKGTFQYQKGTYSKAGERLSRDCRDRRRGSGLKMEGHPFGCLDIRRSSLE